MELWWEKKNPNYLPNLCVVRFTPLKSNTKYFIRPTFLTGQIIPLIHSKVIYVPCDIQSALKLYRNNGPTEHPYSSSSSIPSPSTETRSAQPISSLGCLATVPVGGWIRLESRVEEGATGELSTELVISVGVLPSLALHATFCIPSLSARSPDVLVAAGSRYHSSMAAGSVRTRRHIEYFLHLGVMHVI